VKTTPGRTGLLLSLLVALASSTLLTGCQTTIGGQTLPSPDYLRDDVQYFPAGPEFKLTKTVENYRKYEATQSQLQSQP
jgi:predicted small secreted protein